MPGPAITTPLPFVAAMVLWTICCRRSPRSDNWTPKTPLPCGSSEPLDEAQADVVGAQVEVIGLDGHAAAAEIVDLQTLDRGGSRRGAGGRARDDEAGGIRAGRGAVDVDDRHAGVARLGGPVDDDGPGDLGQRVRRLDRLQPVPILKSIVVRVPAGWASAWRMAARSEPAVGAVLLPLSVVVVTVSVESIWRPSSGSIENRRRSAAARRDAVVREVEAGRSRRSHEMDMLRSPVGLGGLRPGGSSDRRWSPAPRSRVDAGFTEIEWRMR